MVYKFSPLDFQFAWNLETMSEYCRSVSWFQEVFDLRVDVETHTNECYFGLIGMSSDDSSDCRWMRYRPHLPIWSTSFVDKWDRSNDYLSWQCSDQSELEVIERMDEDGDGKTDENVQGFEPVNIDDGDAWEWEE